LREILVALIRFTPFVIGARRGYRLEGDASIGGLLRGVIELPANATSNGVPGGFERRLDHDFRGVAA